MGRQHCRPDNGPLPPRGRIDLSLAGQKYERMREIQAEARSLLNTEIEISGWPARQTKLMQRVIGPIESEMRYLSLDVANVAARSNADIRVKARILRDVISQGDNDTAEILTRSLLKDILRRSD